MNESEFAQRVKQNEHKLFRVAYTVLHHEQDCADALQEALVKAWIRLDSLRNPQYFDTWLMRILINESKRVYNKRRLWLRPCPAPHSPPRNPALGEAIAKLTPALRLPVTLHYLEGYTVEEVAFMLKISPGTVKSRLFNGRKKLRCALESEEEEL